ncbi:MAG: hypothetical protein LWW77_10475 [Propionibacteriales bacterium]|nr:hypothetical protein [Propionibacteriales bacterium]
MTDRMIRTQVAAGHLWRIRAGVFIAADAAADRLWLAARAEQARHPTAVISHAAAATYWRLPKPSGGDWQEDPVILTVAAGSRSHRPGVRYRQAPLPPAEVTRDPAGYRITTAARTAVDLAAGLPLPQALVLLDAALRRTCEGFVTCPRREDYRRGGYVRQARQQLRQAAESTRCRSLDEAIRLADPSRESAIESLSAGYFEGAGLPRPLFQEPVRTRFGTFFPDCLWPEQRLIGEADGAVKYAAKTALVEEKQREQVLRDEGWGFVRWLGKEIMFQPELVVARVARALDARSSSLSAG